MYIRLATKDDIEEITKLYADFTGDYLRRLDTIYDPERTHEAIKKLVENNSVFVAVDNEKILGGMAGTIMPCMFSKDNYFVSLFFYFRPEYRRFCIPFLKHLEQLLLKTNVTRLVIGNPETEEALKMERFYSLMGFRKLETHYFKAV